MNEPLCKLCGVHHWGWCPIKIEVAMPVLMPTPTKITVGYLDEDKPKKKPFDRAAYQREYMRKRREMKEKR